MDFLDLSFKVSFHREYKALISTILICHMMIQQIYMLVTQQYYAPIGKPAFQRRTRRYAS